MMFWIIFAVISFILGVFLIVYGGKSIDDLPMIIGIFCILLALICGITTTVDYCNYQEFRIRYDIVENDYRLIIINEEVDENLKLMTALKVAAINAELAKFKAHKAMFGEFSAYPNEVFELNPIGIEVE